MGISLVISTYLIRQRKPNEIQSLEVKVILLCESSHHNIENFYEAHYLR